MSFPIRQNTSLGAIELLIETCAREGETPQYTLHFGCTRREQGNRRAFLQADDGDVEWMIYPSSVGYADTCLAAARAHRGSDSPPDCHSLPRRRFATSRGSL